MNRDNNQKGFTLIELMLAMGFISFLLIAIAMTVIQIGNIYNRGLILKEINQVGRSIDDELKRSISQSSPFAVDQITPTNYQIIKDGSNITGGRLCLGQYSYIWNYGKYIQSGPEIKNRYTSGGSDIRFVKISDPGASYCVDKTKNIDDNPTSTKPVELLNPGQSNLAIQSFSITSSSSDEKTKQQLYNIVFLIGTNNQQALKNNTSCKPPSELGSDFNFCAINEFKITVRAGGQ